MIAKKARKVAAKAEKSERDPLSYKSWRAQRLAIMKSNNFRCCLCRQGFGAARLTVRHLSFPGTERGNEWRGWRLFCFSCLE